MDVIRPYKATERRGETFSYLPPFTPDKVRKHIAYIIAQGWNPAIEHTEPEKAFLHFWYLWKLPFFGEKSVEKIMAEIEACHRDNAGHVVRLSGFDPFTQCRGTAFIVYRGGR